MAFAPVSSSSASAASQGVAGRNADRGAGHTADRVADHLAGRGAPSAGPQPGRHGFRRCLWRLGKYLVAFFFVLLVLLGGVLYYLLGTLSGAQQGLLLAQRFMPSNILIDTTIESGSVWEGLTLGNTLVEVQDVVSVYAEDLVLRYDLWQLLDQRLVVNELSSQRLSVSLNDKVFAPVPPKSEEPESPPFHLNLPLEIKVEKVDLAKVSFNSQIVDVDVASFTTSLWAHDDNVGSSGITLADLEVHLKNANDLAAAKEQERAAAAVDSSLAIAIDGKTSRLNDVENTIHALVQAAQEGKSVEMVLLRHANEQSAAATEAELLSTLNFGSSNSSSDVASITTRGYRGGSIASAGSNASNSALSDAVTWSDYAYDLSTYSDPEIYALAMEQALLNSLQAPTLSTKRLSIHDPLQGKLSSPEGVADFERQLLAKVRLTTTTAARAASTGSSRAGGASATSASAPSPALASTTNTAQAAATAGSSKSASADASAANADASAASVAHQVASAQTAAAHSAAQTATAQSAAATAAAATPRAAGALSPDSVDGQSGATVAAGAGGVNATTGATASAVAQQARKMPSECEQEVVAKIHEAKPEALLIKEFGSGNGAIAALPTVVLPVNIQLDRLTITQGRYYMEGFDTGKFDLNLTASTNGSAVTVHNLDVAHEMGEVKLNGAIDLSSYYALTAKLTAAGYKNDLTHDFLEGLLYGLNAEIDVNGDLSDLRLHSLLSLGGSSELTARANVLSGALPLLVDLKTVDIRYPIFGEPLVNVKNIDFQGVGNLIDGVALNLDALVTGFDFKDVSTSLNAQVSYEKSHIELFSLDGTYLDEPVKASIAGDVFYGSVLGVDAKVMAQIKDAGLFAPQLKGPLNFEGDLVTILNQKDQAKTAISRVSEPAYLPNRIPKAQASLDDFNANSIEERLLAQVKANAAAGSKGAKANAPVRIASSSATASARAKRSAGITASTTGITASATGITASAADTAAVAASGADASLSGDKGAAYDAAHDVELLAGSGVPDSKNLAQQNNLLLTRLQAVDAASAALAEEELLSQSNFMGVVYHEASPSAVKAVRQGQELSVVRPLRKPVLLADGVPDSPSDLIITPQEYVEAVRFTAGNSKNNGAKVNVLDGAVLDDESEYNQGFLYSLLHQDLPEVMTNIRKVSGSFYLNGYPSTIDIRNVVGDLHQGFRVELLKFTQGENLVFAEGTVTERNASLNSIIDIKNLSSLAPGVEGSLSAQIASSGSLHDLNLELAGGAPLVRSGSFRVRDLVFNSSFNMQTRAINVTVLAERLRFSDAMAAQRQCFLDLSGTPLRHTLSANCGGSNVGFISVDGSYNMQENLYNANLMELYISTENTGYISLQKPVYLEIDLDTLVGSHTPVEIKGDLGQILVTGSKFAPDSVKTQVQIVDFNVGSLHDFFPDSLRMMVPLTADAQIAVQNGHPDIKLLVESKKGLIFTTVGAGIIYDEFTLNSHITDKVMHNTFNMQLRDNRGLITSELNVLDPMGVGTLKGFFRIKDFDLETISNVGQSFNELKGFTNVDTTFAGTMTKPLIYGSINSKGSAIPRYDVGQVNDFDVSLKLKGEQGELLGKVVLNGEVLNINGDLDWSNGANGSLLAKAQNLPVFLVGYGVARANLDAQITLGEVLDIKGEVEIPSAEIAVNNVSSSGASVSSDEILISNQGTSALMNKAPSNFKSAMDLKVRFGDKVHFSAMGMVNGYLGGALAITKDVNSNNIVGNGEINVVDGQADVYGRKFDFEVARIIFRKDIANPTLNIELVADRDYLEDDVEVGVKVAGTASSPDITLFSRPNMSQNEILSYILYGHGLDKSALQTDGGGNNSAMLLGLGVSGLSSVASGLASSFGMSDVQLATQGSGDEMQVAVQGYINRRLRVSYGYGVFSTVGEFKVRYELVRSLYAEFVSSLDQAVDLIYSFEF